MQHIYFRFELKILGCCAIPLLNAQFSSESPRYVLPRGIQQRNAQSVLGHRLVGVLLRFVDSGRCDEPEIVRVGKHRKCGNTLLEEDVYA